MTDKVRAPRGAQENLQLGPREEFGEIGTLTMWGLLSLLLKLFWGVICDHVLQINVCYKSERFEGKWEPEIKNHFKNLCGRHFTRILNCILSPPSGQNADRSLHFPVCYSDRVK